MLKRRRERWGLSKLLMDFEKDISTKGWFPQEAWNIDPLPRRSIQKPRRSFYGSSVRLERSAMKTNPEGHSCTVVTVLHSFRAAHHTLEPWPLSLRTTSCSISRAKILTHSPQSTSRHEHSSISLVPIVLQILKLRLSNPPDLRPRTIHILPHLTRRGRYTRTALNNQ